MERASIVNDQEIRGEKWKQKIWERRSKKEIKQSRIAGGVASKGGRRGAMSFIRCVFLSFLPFSCPTTHIPLLCFLLEHRRRNDRCMT